MMAHHSPATKKTNHVAARARSAVVALVALLLLCLLPAACTAIPIKPQSPPATAAFLPLIPVTPGAQIPPTPGAQIPPTPGAQIPPTDLAGLAIHMEKTACEGPCPVYAVEIEGDGRVIYNGKTCVNVAGEQTGQIAPAAVQALVNTFYQNNFFALEDAYIEDVQDIPAILIRFTLGDQTKQVIKQVYDPAKAPAALKRIEDAIDAAADTQQWVMVNGAPAPCP